MGVMQRNNDIQPVLTAPDGSTKYLPSTLHRVGYQADQQADNRVGLQVAKRVDRQLAAGGHVFILHNQPINQGATS